MVEQQRYNERVRQAISDKYVECSKMYTDTHIDIWDAAREVCLNVSDEMNRTLKGK